MKETDIMSKNALVQINFGELLGEQSSGVFKSTEVKHTDKKTGAVSVIGTRWTPEKNKEAAKLLELEGKANKEEFERTMDEALRLEFRRAKLAINALPEDQMGLSVFEHKRDTKGRLVISMRVRQIPLKQVGFTIDQIAERFGITVPEAEEMMAKNHCAAKPATVVPPAALTEGVKEVAKEAEATEAASK